MPQMTVRQHGFIKAAMEDPETGDRPILQKAYINDGYIISADGYRMHAIKTPLYSDDQFDTGTRCIIMLDVPPETDIDDIEYGLFDVGPINYEPRLSDKQPWLDDDKVKSVIPKGRGERFAISREYLLDAITNMEGEDIVFEFHDQNAGVEIYSDRMYAIIMPKNITTTDNYNSWRPTE